MTIRFSDADRGMTLVELIVGILISGVVLSLIAAIFGNGLVAQQRATERDAVTARLNAVAASVTESVRTSVATRVSDSGRRLDAKVLTRAGTWECRTWHLQGSDLRYSAGATARGAVSTTWKALAAPAVGILPGDNAFAQTGQRVTMGVRLSQGQVDAAVTVGSIAQAVKTGGPACW